MRTLSRVVSLAVLLLTACSDDGRVSRARPAISAEPRVLDFGGLKAGTSRTLQFTVTNAGAADLFIASGSIVADARGAFSVSPLPDQLVPGESASVEVTYAAPALEGTDSAQWVVLSDAANSPELALSLLGRSERACPAGLTQCGSACVDLQAENTNCGACGTGCTFPDRCVLGACQCIKRTCAEVGPCGTASDGCGGTLDCGACSGQLICRSNQCVPPTCSDGEKNQGETGTDCGGPCTPCGLGGGCATRADCSAGLVCSSGTCSACAQTSECPSDQVCRSGVCGDCQSRAECGGGRACIGGRCLSCPTEASFNECGLCGGPAVSGVGATCLLPNNCSSTFACDAQQTGVTCTPVAKNECGLCAGPGVSGLGSACSSQQSGCDSALTCNVSNDAAVCAEVPRNACNVCGGPAITGLGDACDSNGCPSTKVCDSAGTGVTCTPKTKNGCGVCEGVAVMGIGDSCTLPNGCTSTLTCNAAGDGTECVDVQKNACDLCGGPLITGKGQACNGLTGCAGVKVCNAAGTDVECNAPATCFQANHVVISQLSGGTGGGLDDDFIELYNPTNAPVDVTGWVLWYRTASRTSDWTQSVALPAVVLPARGYLLGRYSGGNWNYAGSCPSTPPMPPRCPDFTYNFNTSAVDGQTLLWSDSNPPPGNPTASSPGYVDGVGYGAAAWSEGTAATAGATGKSLMRKAGPSASSTSMATGGADAARGNGVDTDDNSADFVLMGSGTFSPRNSSNTAAP
ncbi:MAG: hypothetical protein RL653_465 [Pseudomonadota bacterium]|jgi:hypothetical protein